MSSQREENLESHGSEWEIITQTSQREVSTESDGNEREIEVQTKRKRSTRGTESARRAKLMRRGKGEDGLLYKRNELLPQAKQETNSRK